MSLLDDVSIVVTPNGYKAGELYAVVPVPTEGAEEVTNGKFATADLSSFNTTYATQAIVSEELKVTLNTANGYGFSYVTFPAVIGRSYRVQVDAQQGTGSTTNVKRNSGITIANENNAGSWSYDEIGVATATSCAIRLQLYGASGDYAIFDNVSVKEYTSADMDVTRATAATRVDEDGLVNYAEIIGDEEVTNGDFSGGSTGWTLSGAWSLGTNKVIFSDTSNGDIRTSTAIFTATKTYQIKLTVADLTGSNTAFFGIGDGSASNLVGYDNYANGDYTFNVIAPNGSGFRIYSTTSSGSSYSITNISIKEVTRDNVPRIDYTGGGCPHILAEPQRTNQITQSENFSSYLSNATQELNSNISPSGMLNASNVYPTTSGGSRGISSSMLGIAATEYTISIFAKSNGKNFVFCTNVSNSSYGVWFDLSNESLSGSDASNAKIISYGNDWYKLTYTSTSTSTTIWSRFLISETNGSTTVTANGTDGVLFWGAQVEQGSYATSYIPTSGSTVTRNQDIFTRDGIGSLINSTEGVLFVEMAVLSADTINRYISLSNGTDDNSISFHFRNNSNNQVRVILKSGNSNQFDATYRPSGSTDFAKVGFKYKVNDFALWVNGTEIATDTSGITFSADTLNRLAFDDGNGNSDFFGKVKQLQVYKTALTDTQLAALTS